MPPKKKAPEPSKKTEMKKKEKVIEVRSRPVVRAEHQCKDTSATTPFRGFIK